MLRKKSEIYHATAVVRIGFLILRMLAHWYASVTQYDTARVTRQLVIRNGNRPGYLLFSVLTAR